MISLVHHALAGMSTTKRGEISQVRRRGLIRRSGEIKGMGQKVQGVTRAGHTLVRTVVVRDVLSMKRFRTVISCCPLLEVGREAARKFGCKF
jgi:predicted NAD-dependent protein-ADP-ribosyltransferase YbiA (DUF1768 family)